MANGLPLMDVKQVNSSPEFKSPNTFTPFSNEMLRNAQETNLTHKEAPKYSEPTLTNNEKQLTDQLLAEIMKEEPKKPQKTIPQIEKKTTQEVEKSQGFWSQLLDWFRTTFRNLFR
ncbi:MAG: hypothetical protein NUV46_00730 [Nanoarchaeota archaeon]|nr:hypothetical protein [Nanoarchaeota archaeon]